KEADFTSPRWKGIDSTEKPPVIPRSPREELATFVLQPGFKMEPVLTEPHIKEPAAIQFDGNGRMYVLDLRSYMQGIVETVGLLPLSRISRCVDTDNYVIFDHGIVLLDMLVLPWFVIPFGSNTILFMDSNEDNVYTFADTAY